MTRKIAFSRVAALPPRIWILCIMLLASAFYLLNFNSFRVGSYQDDARYIIVAKALSSGHGFSLINFPGNVPETNYPPGFPLLLAPLIDL